MGCIGDDDFGKKLIDACKKARVLPVTVINTTLLLLLLLLLLWLQVKFFTAPLVLCHALYT